MTCGQPFLSVCLWSGHFVVLPLMDVGCYYQSANTALWDPSPLLTCGGPLPFCHKAETAAAKLT